MTEYIIEVGKIQFYISLPDGTFQPHGYVHQDGTITVYIIHNTGHTKLTFEDEVRLLEVDTHKVLFDSTDEQWGRYR